MIDDAHGATRERLLEAAAGLIAASPGEDFSLRAVCEIVGVKLPTLYHFFGSKQGLVDAVVEHGFDLYMAQKAAHESSGDPIQDLRDGWDMHVAFGLENAGFYTIMYGKIRPGYSPPAQARPSVVLRSLTAAAHAQGRLVVPPEQAAAHVLVANIGVTLRQIILDAEDRPLSIAVREGALAAITGTSSLAGEGTPPRTDIHRVLEYAATRPGVLGHAETQLLTEWLHRLATADDRSV